MTVSHTSVLTPMAAALPPNTDLGSIRFDLSDDHVAAPEGKDQTELAEIVVQARAQGIKLDIVVIAGNPGRDSDLRDLATAVGKTEGGTVVVLSDDWVGTYSDSISRVKLERAEDVSKSQQGHSAQAAQLFVNQLERPDHVSWNAITAVLLAGTVIAAGGLYVVKARRAAALSPQSAASDHLDQ